MSIEQSRLRSLLSGAGIAAVAGLLMGAAMKPDLRADGRPAGPQVFAGWAGTRSTGPFDDGASFTRYGAAVPDYVLGTDWTRPPRITAAIPEAETRDAELAQTQNSPVNQAAPRGPPETAPVRVDAAYPSLSGGADYGPPPDPESAAVG